MILKLSDLIVMPHGLIEPRTQLGVLGHDLFPQELLHCADFPEIKDVGYRDLRAEVHILRLAKLLVQLV